MWDVARLTSHNNVIIIISSAPSIETSGVITVVTQNIKSIHYSMGGFPA